ncbi:ADP-ribosylation factor-like protein 6-interacting protein 4 [Drosophila sulfurigaster albostrigata]|uniref:ADP-ribosylation factor-like protein 6-interacting protein 4 n=1 Tax=Drosophila sulfurigaster albostrigata TaxID=89887 RepID=UPI002D21DA53|nr:ADP-ribosylation factor-like protein 6-interacting protein 4 [Drosophila sulfurigaster albostrigata]
MGKSEKKSKRSKEKHKSKRKEHKEKHKDKSKKSKKHSKNKATKEATMTPKIEAPKVAPAATVDSGSEEDFAIPIALMNSKSHAPETPEEYQRRQSQIRREVDPVTGRTRLIKGDSEVLEEIVSKERHHSINKKATSGDGEYFEMESLAAAKRQKPK